MQICCAGEAMIEITANAAIDAIAPSPSGHPAIPGDCGAPESGAHRSAGQAAQRRASVAGDTYNTAVYLARSGLPVSYLTRLGDDPASGDILAALRAEHIDTHLVTRWPGRTAGRYTISNDAGGERSFNYERAHSPARECFAQVPDLGNTTHFYFSGITVAITRADHANLVSLLRALRSRNCQILFDPNYRPVLWDSAEQAQHYLRSVLPFCSSVFPTLDDEQSLWGSVSAKDCHAFYAGYNIDEIVIKGSALTTHAFSGSDSVCLQAAPVAAVDTTGAGDAFNAGYIAARLRGAALQHAVHCAQTLAAQVVQQHGAILPAAGNGHLSRSTF